METQVWVSTQKWEPFSMTLSSNQWDLVLKCGYNSELGKAHDFFVNIRSWHFACKHIGFNNDT